MCCALVLWATSGRGWAQASIPNPVVYVEQVPVPQFRTKDSVVAISGTHLADAVAAPRGGGLMIRYPDGDVRDLTAAAGYGSSGALQDGQAIAVRDPSVHWSGTKVLFSMVVGAPLSESDHSDYFWQLYEVSGLGAEQQPVITRVVGQPEDSQNIQPTYGTDERIIFVSDEPISGSGVTRPVIDEQGTSEAVTGLWSLDPSDGALTLLEHSPSGSFEPMVDSFGRVVFSRWDHLQRDARAGAFGAVDYANESSGSPQMPWLDVFPEPLQASGDTLGHHFDQFLPWTVNEDGSGLETMNHLGRHELSPFSPRAIDSPGLVDFEEGIGGGRLGAATRAGSYLQIVEDPLEPGRYVATDAATHASSAGRLVSLTASPGTNPDDSRVRLVNGEGTARDPSYLSDGRLMASLVVGVTIDAVYGVITDFGGGSGTGFIPGADSPFTIMVARPNQRDRILQGGPLTAIRSKRVEMYLPGAATPHVDAEMKLWQLQAVELVARPVPSSMAEPPIGAPEASVFADAGIEVEALREWLRENDKALLISRDITSRDANDRQQLFDLSVSSSTAPFKDVHVNPVESLGFFQGDYVREYPIGSGLPAGRRVVARPLHDGFPAGSSGLPLGSTRVAPDGSMAMIVPAKRAAAARPRPM